MIRPQFSFSPKPFARTAHGRRRGERGASTIALVLILVFFGILPLALLGFEMARASLVQIELQNVTDSAALGATAVLAGGSGSNATNSQLNAIQGGLEFFVMNSIMNVPLYANTGAAPLLPTGFPTATANVSLYYPPSGGGTTPTFANGPNALWPANNALPVGQAWFVCSFYDNTGAAQPLGTAAVQTIQIQTFFTEAPIFFGTFLPIAQQFTVSAVSYGGLPMLDLVLCFDMSGSMDDATPVCLVERYWQTTPAQVIWATCVGTGLTSMTDAVTNPMGTYTFSPCGGDPTACLDNIATLLSLSTATSPNGTSTNAAQPQQLIGMDYKYYSPASPPAHEYTFANDNGCALRILPNSASAVATSAAIIPEAGCVPGNTPTPLSNGNLTATNPTPPSPTLGGANQTQFTDMVVLLGSVQSTSSTFNFLNSPAVCVEASRGNMESMAEAVSALNLASGTSAIPAGTSTSYSQLNTAMSANAGGGWYQAYWYGARCFQFPMVVSIQSAIQFIQTMTNSSNAHFGIVCFSGQAPGATGAVWNPASDALAATGNYNADLFYPNPGTSLSGTNANPATNNALAGFPLPYVALSSTLSNETTCETALTGDTGSTTQSQLAPTYLPATALGGTDMVDAMTNALGMFSGGRRTNAKPAAVLFTDGIPDRPIGGSNDYGTFAEASAYNSSSIPLFTIGLYQNNAVATAQNSILGDGHSSAQGIAYYSGNGATFNQVSASSGESGLNAAFQAIAKSLVVLQQTK